MTPVGSKPMISEGEQPQAHTFSRVANGYGIQILSLINYQKSLLIFWKRLLNVTPKHDKLVWNTWNCVICYVIVISSRCDHDWSSCCAGAIGLYHDPDPCHGCSSSRHDPGLYLVPSPSYALAHGLHVPSLARGLYRSSPVVSAVCDLQQFSEIKHSLWQKSASQHIRLFWQNAPSWWM